MKKNLSKVLTLVLAFAMVLGLMTVGASAAFTDDAAITYKPAVDMLSGLGVINGNPDGSFNPNGNFDRGGLAKMVAYFTWGGADKSSLYANAKVFSDLAGYEWAAGAINYGYNAGYINGVDSKNYDPDGAVTGSALAKTLLVVLGYKANAEDAAYALVGGNWELNAIRLAEAEGLFAGLKAGFDPTANLTREEAAQIFANLLAKTYTYTAYNKDNTPITAVGQLGVSPMAKYFAGWTPALDQDDDFGRPINTYTKAGKTITVGVNPTKTYTTAVSGAQIFADLGLTANKTATTYTDGKAVTGTFSVAYTNVAGTIGGNGAVTEVYYNAAAGTVEIVVINTYFDTVDSVTPATAVSKEYATITDGNFIVSGLKQYDAVLYTKATTATTPSTVTVVKSMQVVTPTQMAATSYTATNFVANGTTYTYSAQMAAAQEIDALVAPFAPVKVYFDNYGYVIATAGVDAALPNYAVVLTTTTVPATWPAVGNTYKAQVVLADGSVVIFDNVKDITGLVKGDIVTYADGTGADTGKVVLTEKAAMQDPAATFAATTGTVAITGGKANSTTIFVVETLAPVTSVPSYTAYVGISNVPTITAATNYAYYDNTVPSADGYADIVFVQAATLYTAPVTASDVIYVDASSKVNHTTATGSYSVYNAVVNGVPTTIQTTTNYFSVDGLYGKVTTTNGLISGADALHNPAAGIIVVDTPVTGTTAAKNGVVKFNTTELTYTDATQVYMVTATGIAASNVASIKTDANDTVVYYTVNGVLAAAYITVVA